MKTNKIFVMLNSIILLIFVLVNSTFAHEGATGVVKERMDKFKMSKSMMQKINIGLRENDFENIEKSAQKLLSWSKEMSKYFPEGSDVSPSEASKNIWLDPNGFSKAIKNFEEASLELVNQAQAENSEASIQAFRNLANTCKGCHQKFRN
jgi:cytochrome c556